MNVFEQWYLIFLLKLLIKHFNSNLVKKYLIYQVKMSYLCLSFSKTYDLFINFYFHTIKLIEIKLKINDTVVLLMKLGKENLR